MTWWLEMTDRWTMVSQRIAASDAVRIEDVRRRSEGLRYWLLVPFAWLFIYAGALWIAILVLSPVAKVRRLFSK